MRAIDADVVASGIHQAYMAMQTKLAKEKPELTISAARFAVSLLFRDIYDFIVKQPTIEIPTWIPCEERLPSIGEKVLVSTNKTCFIQVFKGVYSEPTIWHWEHRSIKKIIAWMPLPQPYRGENNND